jgi:hypothetical protein
MNDQITELQDNEIFVYGSNLLGVNGAGAARFAQDNFGARHGVAFGLSGQCFAIPTKDDRIQTLSLDQIDRYVTAFLAFAEQFEFQYVFLVTEIGCGLAGYHPKDIAPMFTGATKNVVLPPRFVEIICDPNRKWKPNEQYEFKQ